MPGTGRPRDFTAKILANRSGFALTSDYSQPITSRTIQQAAIRLPPQPDSKPMKTLNAIKARVLIAPFAICPFLPLEAEPVWEWARHGASAGNFDGVYGRGVATDPQGNIYVVGKFAGSATFSDTQPPLASFGDSDAFLAKYDPQGSLHWVQRFGGTSTDEANAVATDVNGMVLVAGRHFGPGVFGSFTLTNTDSATGFTLKFDPATTNVVWAKEDGLVWWGVAVDLAGNTCVVGEHQGVLFAGAKKVGPIALAKYDANGNRQWYTNCLSPSLFTTGSGRAIGVDAQGNVYLTGIFHSVVEFGEVSLTNAVAPNNSYDEIFVARFNSAGVPQWARRGGGEGDDQGLGLGVDADGNVIVTGVCDATTRLNSGASVPCDIGGFAFPADVNHGGLGNLFLVKFDAVGNGVWARKLPGRSLGTSVGVAPSGTFQVAGTFTTTPLDFGGASLAKPYTSEELFVMNYDASGTALGGRCSTSTNVSVRIARAVATSADGSIYETGEYQGSSATAFDGTVLPSKTGAPSMYLAKLSAQGAGRPTVQSLTLLGGGVLQMTIPNADGQQFVVEASDTVAGFLPVATNQVAGTALQFTDPAFSVAGARFYRLRLP